MPSRVAGVSSPVVRPSASSPSLGASEPPSSAGTIPSEAFSTQPPFSRASCSPTLVPPRCSLGLVMALRYPRSAAGPRPWRCARGGACVRRGSTVAVHARAARVHRLDEAPLVVVDGVHALAAVERPLAGADVFVAGTHKWLCGPRGTGVIWARSWDALRPVIPTF